MCKAVAELAQDDNKRFKVCGSLPSFLACLLFQFYDISIVIITILAYFIINTMKKDGHLVDVDLLVPMGALFLSAVTFLSGPLGLFLWKPSLLWAYFIRLCLLLLYSLGWVIYIFMEKDRKRISEMIMGGVWSAAVLHYAWGIFVTLKAITYLSLHYRGYDDVDPANQKYFDDKLRDLMVEIEERERAQQTAKLSQTSTRTCQSSQTTKRTTSMASRKKGE